MNNYQDQIEIHIRTYRSLLKSAGEIRINKLIDSHLSMDSILHEKGKGKKIDTSAFIYSLLRLPSIMSTVKQVVLGQSEAVFRKHDFSDVEKWDCVTAPGRRRKMFYNGNDILAMYIASVTDVDDIITLLTAFQIEWNKFHNFLKNSKNVEKDAYVILEKTDADKIRNIWGMEFHKFLTAIKFRDMDFTVRLLSGSYVEYAKSTQFWLQNIKNSLPEIDLQKRPYYFISSNTHSIINLISGFALMKEKEIIEFLYKTQGPDLISFWKDIQSGKSYCRKEFFLNYIMKKLVSSDDSFRQGKKAYENHVGINHIQSSHYLDIDAQVIEVKNLVKVIKSDEWQFDPESLAGSPAIIINIDYPLGWAAYQVITELGQNLDDLRGIYIMGKAAALNGHIGDIMLPDTVFDTHTKNTFALNNSFKASDFESVFKGGIVLDHQKSISVKGTFFENRNTIDEWFKSGFTDIEMESGPYLNGLYEFIFYNRYIENQFVNVSDPGFELGIAHYTSDTPNSKAKNLGVRNLSFEGIEPTYAISRLIIKKIADRELSFLKKG